MDSFYKALPRLVPQDEDTSCWAAVFESWVAAIVPQRKSRPTQKDLIANWADLTYDDGSIKPESLTDSLAPSYGMETDWVSPSTITPNYIATKLSTFGHLVLGYNRGKRGGHVVVCYGVGRPTGSQQLVSVMDPSNGDGGFKNRGFGEFKGISSQGNKVFVGWPKQGLNPDYF
ncbi:MAG: hypothetical protein ACREO5_11620 [Candidatus Binatia bacterium]